MSSYEYAFYAFRYQLTGLSYRGLAQLLAEVPYYLWEPFYRQLAWFLANKPGVRGWFWATMHERAWQKSSAVSGLEWLDATAVFYKLVGQLGYGWEVNVAVSLVFDLVGYLIHWRWIFGDQKVDAKSSYAMNFGVWAAFFGINVFLSWLVFGHLGIGALYGRCLLGAYGVAVNPLMFFLRKNLIFNGLLTHRLPDAAWRLLRRTEMA